MKTANMSWAVEQCENLSLGEECDALSLFISCGITIDTAIERAIEIAQKNKKDCVFVFNGTPIVVTSYSDATVIKNEWHNSYIRRKLDNTQKQIEEKTPQDSLTHF